MITAYIVISTVFGALWIWAYKDTHVSDMPPIYISKKVIREWRQELNTTVIGDIAITLVCIVYNFFILPWSIIGILYKLSKKIMFKPKGTPDV